MGNEIKSVDGVWWKEDEIVITLENMKMCGSRCIVTAALSGYQCYSNKRKVTVLSPFKVN